MRSRVCEDLLFEEREPGAAVRRFRAIASYPVSSRLSGATNDVERGPDGTGEGGEQRHPPTREEPAEPPSRVELEQ